MYDSTKPCLARYKSQSLRHSGVKGQKWGVRKYQNEDGKLTDLGRDHYGVGEPIDTKKESGAESKIKAMYSKLQDKDTSKELDYIIGKLKSGAYDEKEALAAAESAVELDGERAKYLAAQKEKEQKKKEKASKQSSSASSTSSDSSSKKSASRVVESNSNEPIRSQRDIRSIIEEAMKGNRADIVNSNGIPSTLLGKKADIAIKTDNGKIEPFSDNDSSTKSEVLKKRIENRTKSDKNKNKDKDDDNEKSKEDEHKKRYIAHSGIKGMKWGIRRYQNEDGTLTPAGKERYYAMRTKLDRLDKAVLKKTKRAARADSRLERAAVSILSPLYSDKSVAKRNTASLQANLGLKKATVKYKKLERRFKKEFGHITTEQANEIMSNHRGFKEKAYEFIQKITKRDH